MAGERGLSARGEVDIVRELDGEVRLGHADLAELGQWMIGIGAPQYRCREISQSRSRYEAAARPLPSASSHSITR